MFSRRLIGLVGFSAMLAGGCATTSPPSPDGDRHVIRVSTHSYPRVPDRGPGGTAPVLGWGTGKAPEPAPVAGARCRVSNDRGTWTVTTPGTIEVVLSRRSPLLGPPSLQVACRQEGFKDVSQELPCLSRRKQAAGAGMAVGTYLGAGAAYGLALAAAAPAAIVGALVLPMIAGGTAGHALAGPDEYGCVLEIEMRPAP